MEIIKGTTKKLPLIKKEGQRETHLQVEVGYDLGGNNWWNGAYIQRGYYLYCTPAEITTHAMPNGTSYDTIRHELGKGKKLLLKAVNRRSTKAEADAIARAEMDAKWLIETVCATYGLELEKEVAENG